ncbi:MAG TPA: hypothetical protein VJK04_04240 [Candidatus Paceibacterota bacterium]
MRKPNKIVLAVLIMALIVLAVAPRPVYAFGGLEIVSVVIAGVMAAPLVFRATVNFFKEMAKDETAKPPEPKKESVQNEDSKEPITVSPEQIFSN